MKALSAACFVLLAASAVAQNNEITLTVGGYLPHHIHVRSDNLLALEGNLARQIFHVPKASLYIEVPVVATLGGPGVRAFTILPGQSFNTRHYSALFVSPGLRVKLLPDSRVSPYLAIGGGLAHFSKSHFGGESSTNTNVFDLGGGVDVKLTRFVALRGEVRDFYSGAPQLITGLRDREHQILATGGIVLRF